MTFEAKLARLVAGAARRLLGDARRGGHPSPPRNTGAGNDDDPVVVGDDDIARPDDLVAAGHRDVHVAEAFPSTVPWARIERTRPVKPIASRSLMSQAAGVDDEAAHAAAS